MIPDSSSCRSMNYLLACMRTMCNTESKMHQAVCGVQYVLTLSNLQSFQGSSLAILSHFDSNRRRFTSNLDSPITHVTFVLVSTNPCLPARLYFSHHRETLTWNKQHHEANWIPLNDLTINTTNTENIYIVSYQSGRQTITNTAIATEITINPSFQKTAVGCFCTREYVLHKSLRVVINRKCT